MSRKRDDTERDPPAHRDDGTGSADATVLLPSSRRSRRYHKPEDGEGRSLTPECGRFDAGVAVAREAAEDRGHRACRACYPDAPRPDVIMADGGDPDEDLPRGLATVRDHREGIRDLAESDLPAADVAAELLDLLAEYEGDGGSA